MRKDEVAFSNSNILGRMMDLSGFYLKKLDELCMKYHIAGSQHPIITIICRNPGTPQLELMNWLRMNPSTITRNVTAAINHGYIERKRMESDKRNWLLYPTQKALDIYDEIVKLYDDTMKEMLEPLSEEESRMLVLLLEKLSAKIENQP